MVEPLSSLDLINALYVSKSVSLSAPQLLLEKVYSIKSFNTGLFL